MASFQEKITILIETKVDSAKSQLSGLKQSISDAEGATGKLKAAAGGMGSAIESAAGAFLSPAGLAAGAAAVGGAAIKAVSQFEQLGLTIGKVRDGTGLSAEAASRWVEVADDAGISTESFTKSVGFLEKAIGTNKESFTQWGVEIAKNADGTTDMNQTLLNAIGVLNGIEDPVKRNAAGLALFGRNWKDMSELIGRGADGVKKSLDAVQSTKVFSDKDINTSRDVRGWLRCHPRRRRWSVPVNGQGAGPSGGHCRHQARGVDHQGRARFPSDGPGAGRHRRCGRSGDRRTRCDR